MMRGEDRISDGFCLFSLSPSLTRSREGTPKAWYQGKNKGEIEMEVHCLVCLLTTLSKLIISYLVRMECRWILRPHDRSHARITNTTY